MLHLGACLVQGSYPILTRLNLDYRCLVQRHLSCWDSRSHRCKCHSLLKRDSDGERVFKFYARPRELNLELTSSTYSMTGLENIFSKNTWVMAFAFSDQASNRGGVALFIPSSELVKEEGTAIDLSGFTTPGSHYLRFGSQD